MSSFIRTLSRTRITTFQSKRFVQSLSAVHMSTYSGSIPEDSSRFLKSKLDRMSNELHSVKETSSRLAIDQSITRVLKEIDSAKLHIFLDRVVPDRKEKESSAPPQVKEVRTIVEYTFLSLLIAIVCTIAVCEQWFDDISEHFTLQKSVQDVIDRAVIQYSQSVTHPQADDNKTKQKLVPDRTSQA